MSTQLRRRAGAAHRLEGGDPWRRVHEDGEPTPTQLEAWCHAVSHLLSDGATPVVPAEVLRAMYRRGGQQRTLAENVHENGGFA